LKRSGYERAFVELLRRSAGRGSRLELGLGDDAALLRPGPGKDVALTCDLLIESVHFDLKFGSPWQLGAKALAASLSDLAAMGAQPKAYLVSLSIPRRPSLKTAFFKALYAGMRAWGEAFGASLAGGDSTASPGPLVIDIFAIGEVEKGRALRRSGARPGDLLFCTGNLGDSAAGLACLKHGSHGLPRGALAVALKRHLTPVPRCQAGRFLLQRNLANACIDISDGLSSESHHLARESKIAIDIEAEAVPLSAAARKLARKLKRDPLEWALSGGEDYELLFTAPASKLSQLERDFSRLTGLDLHCMGRVRPGRGVRIRQNGRLKPLADKGYEHRIF
jgi:thiamine-monophosphate kinase